MTMQKVPMTLAGAKALKNELKQLKREERPKVIEAIAEARSHGDLSENAEYDAAKNQQAFLEGRIREIETSLARAEVIDTASIRSDKIVFGAHVTLLDEETDAEKTYHIVGVDEADLTQGKISITSPMARAMINKEEGDLITVRAPGGERSFEILAVDFS